MESSITACPHARALERAFALGIDERSSAHLETCASCRAEWTAMEGVVATAQDLARDLPREPWSASRKAELRESLQVNAQIALHDDRRTYGRGGALAIALGVVIVLSGAMNLVLENTHTPSEIFARTGSVYSNTFDSGGQRVRLSSGTLTINVPELAGDEHFVLVTDHAQVEVRSGGFQATATNDRLQSVDVFAGLVWLRVGESTEIMLKAGEHWDPHQDAIQQQEREFKDGWEAMRAGNPQMASAHFWTAERIAPETALAEDARYWMTMVEAERGGVFARAAYERFLTRHSQSPRAGDVSAKLGWALLDNGELDAAEQRFNAALDDAAPAVAQDARKGLEELKKRRKTR